MPIESNPSALYEVSNVRCGFNKKGERYVTWDRSDDVDAYVLCMVKGAPLRREELADVVSEEKLSTLYRSGHATIQLADGRSCTLQGIPIRMYDDDSCFVLDIEPPMTLQVWVMKRAYAICHLFVPTDPQRQMCLLPTEYSVDFVKGNPAADEMNARLSWLTIRIDDADNYEDGALSYWVGTADPIPIPRRWINLEIPLLIVDTNVTVRVGTTPGCREAYVRHDKPAKNKSRA